MAPRIVVVGGGSYQWVPKLLVDIVNTPSLADAHLVLEDVDPRPLPTMEDLARHLVSLRGTAMRVSTATDQRAALEGADFVVVSISTGGFDSMRHDLEIPQRYGVRHSVGDTVGPAGIVRALRNVPVLLGIARDMQELCPDAWLLNLTNPMTALCRAVTRETPVKAVGLCHEVAGAQHTLSLLLGADYRDFDLVVAGVNHLPLVTQMRVGDDDGFARVREAVERVERHGDERARLLLAGNAVKLECLARFGALPAAGDRHVVEFFPWFLTEESDWGRRWGVQLTTIAEREAWLEYFRAELGNLRAADSVPTEPSGEMVAPIIDSFLRDRPRDLPLNLPNTGQCPDLPAGAVVEAMCTADGSGLHPRDRAEAPPLLAEWLRRVVTSQETTVEAAVSGARDKVVEAMLLDPLASRVDFDGIVQMTDEMLAATKQWLPQFA
jgi:alpha-galactosidase